MNNPQQSISPPSSDGEGQGVRLPLSPVQREAVEYITGPSLVIAGAGSGKTRVLTYKIAYLLQHGYQPWSILALTFTNKAAKEMKERIAKIVGNDTARYLVMGTFHSIFSRILRYEADKIGYDHNFTIYDDSDTRAVIKTAAKEVLEPLFPQKEQLDNAMKAYKPQTIAARIGLAKNAMITAKQYGETRKLVERDTINRTPEIYKIYKVYERLLHENNAMDFDDLLLNTYALLKDNEQVRQKYAQQFQFILVDEYQDTNIVQQKILELLAFDHQRICVVGDDAQSIYAFRGANIDNILNFEHVYPICRQFKLEENYRSTKSIVAVANNLISHNQRQIPKNVFSNNSNGEKPELIKAASDELEASIVGKKILRINAVEHIPFNEMVILYRANAQSRKFEDVFRKERIPYK
ncbi:MAG: UvrD-helicase domain-containing protein, partial [Bacteroidaceae bacterium]|nr:UvrD-helicase domain-containing protein [Bacteroidaceae bacterium]